MLTGRPPFLGSTNEVIAQVLRDEPRSASDIRGGLDAAWSAVCVKAMAKEPSQRFASMSKFAAAIAKAEFQTTQPKKEQASIKRKQTVLPEQNSKSAKLSRKAERSAARPVAKSGKSKTSKKPIGKIRPQRMALLISGFAAVLLVLTAVVSLQWFYPEAEVTDVKGSSDSNDSHPAETQPRVRGREEDSNWLGEWIAYDAGFPGGKTTLTLRANGTLQFEHLGTDTNYEFTTVRDNQYDRVKDTVGFSGSVADRPESRFGEIVIRARGNDFQKEFLTQTDFQLFDGETWLFTSTDPSTMSVTRRINASTVVLGGLDLERPPGVGSPRLLSQFPWIVGSWKLSPDRYHTYTADGWLFDYRRTPILDEETAVEPASNAVVLPADSTVGQVNPKPTEDKSPSPAPAPGVPLPPERPWQFKRYRYTIRPNSGTISAPKPLLRREDEFVLLIWNPGDPSKPIRTHAASRQEDASQRGGSAVQYSLVMARLNAVTFTETYEDYETKDGVKVPVMKARSVIRSIPEEYSQPLERSNRLPTDVRDAESAD